MWSNFEASPLEDETISNVFSSRGIFKIKSDERLEEYPLVQASVQGGKMVISIDKSLLLLEDELVAKCSFLSFCSKIDDIAISNSGDLIICGLCNGEVHGVYIKGVLLFSVCIDADDVDSTSNTFKTIQKIGQRFYFTCRNGSIYCLSEIDESRLDTLNANDTMGSEKAILDDVSIQRLTTARFAGVSDSVDCAMLLRRFETHIYAENNQEEPDSDLGLVVEGVKGTLVFKTASNDVTRIRVPANFGSIRKIYNLDHYIIALTSSGYLLNVCPITRTISSYQQLEQPELLVDDLVVMECSEESIELLVLTKSTGGEDGRLIKIVEYPSMKCKNEVEVPEQTWLVQQPKCAVNLYYLASRNTDPGQIPDEVEMLLVSETDPSDRFKKLIAKGRLEEAEEFGKQFELCLQPIFEAKAKRILIELCNINAHDANKLDEKFQTMLDLLSQVESKKFILNNRMINLPSRQILERYLREIVKRLDFEEDNEHVLEINEQLHRLKTLAITDPYECNTEWQKFVYHRNLVKMVKSLFISDMPVACLIWRRHSSSILPHLHMDEMRKLMSFIPGSTEPINVVQWLRQFIPTVCNTHPSVMPFITDWSIEKTRELQYVDLWPDIGLEFATKILEIFEEIEFIYSDVRRQHERNIGKLRDLVNALQDLSVLKSSYKLVITLDNYMQDSIDATALCILQRVHLDKLQSLVNDFLYPIFQEKGLTPANAIKNYLSQLVTNHQSLSNWLERSVACIEMLHNEDSRLECALNVLQNAPVPWPDSLMPLIKLRTSTHPLATKINAEYEIQVIKIMKVKYGWPADSAVGINLELFAMRIIKLNLPDMLQDIRTLTMAAPEVASIANFNCCYQMARRGQIESAYEFFKSLNNEKDAKYGKEVVENLTNLLESSSTPLLDENKVLEHSHVLELLKLMLPHVEPVYERRYLLIKHRFILRKQFNLDVNHWSNLITNRCRDALLDEAIERIMERSQATLNVPEFISSEMGELCKALGLQKVYGLQRICQRMNCLPLSCALAYYVIEFIDCVPGNQGDFTNLGVELLVQQITAAKSQPNGASSSLELLNENDPLAFPLAYELLTSALLHEQNCKRDLVDLIKYVRVAMLKYSVDAIETYYQGNVQEINDHICRALDGAPIAHGETTLNFSTTLNGSFDVKTSQPQPKKRYSVSMFDDVDVQLQLPSKQKKFSGGRLPAVRFLAHTLLLMVIETTPTNSLLLQIRNALPENMRTDFDGARADFFLSLEQLIKAKEHDVWYIMAQHLLEYQNQNRCKKIISAGFVSLQLRRFFRNAMNDKDVNFIELFSMLVSDCEALAQLDKLASDVKTDQQNINFLTLSQMYNMYIEDMDNVQELKAKRIKLFYYTEFCQQDPNFKGKFNDGMDNIEDLLKEFHNKQLNVKLLERISRDFGLDYQKLLINQILSILGSQELRYEIKHDAFGDEELIMLSSEQKMFSMCQPYLSEINKVELFTSKLKQFIEEINLYFYELYLCVIEMLEFFDSAPKEMKIWTSILHFLKHKMITRRRNRPSQLETDLWLQSQKENGVQPKIARYRLPFKPIVEQPLKDILESELNVDNCQSWFPLIQMYTALKGSKDISQNCDYFCMSAVKNSINEYKSKNDSDAWSLYPTNNAFLKSVLRLTKNVHSPSKVFLILYFVASYAPDGADQVEASYECWKYVKENAAVITDPKYQEQLTKIKRKYPIIKTQHLLYVYGLPDEKLLRLVENPTELIISLYNHELILKSTKLDINTLVKDIANLHELDLDAIQFKLLQKWLSVTMEPADGTMLEETFLEDQHYSENGGGDESTKASENVIRANYLLSSWEKSQAVELLVGFIFKDGSVNTSNQLQMYECYSKLNDGSSYFNNRIKQRQYITIKCVHELNALGYKTNIEKFADEHCNKIDILKMIWQRNAQNPLSLQVMANICLGFNIHLPKIWNGIFKRMVMANMVRELNALVDVLSCKPQLLHTEGLALAWDCVLCHPLQNAVQTRSFAQEEKLHKTLLRLQSCPVVHALNLCQFAELCMLIHRPHMAAVLLSFCQSVEDREKIKKLISAQKVDNLRKQILELEEVGMLSVVLNFALKELNL
ncbi:uncharacterized protein LOC115621201 [Scaptodrosophila lebanonensis]|uniref:Uncharacterized protein LOC115621201 n=1 Tax=Drosophila lebanonensis TaxID=7225 RepID=A0A6J2T5T5_DROLE|nr:uncharacterized protein LOC115621201 [Scaptodrosophila lebanonensis]